ncbi:MAG: hypothetical protein ACI9FN_002075 [Saprospiraceae bacterium]|jgi:hypothetical protein
MEVQGKVKLVGEVQTFGSNGFRKRELVVTTDEQYPQHIMIEFVQDKTALLDSFPVGSDVKVSINLRGREWTNPQGEVKYFNSIQGWRIEVMQAAAPAMSAPSAPSDPGSWPKPSDEVKANTTEDFDDLPF